MIMYCVQVVTWFTEINFSGFHLGKPRNYTIEVYAKTLNHGATILI